MLETLMYFMFIGIGFMIYRFFKVAREIETEFEEETTN